MKQAKRKLGPWELSHPTYSFRVPPELHEQVEAMRKQRRLQEILLRGLEFTQAEVKAEKDAAESARKRGYSQGYDRGTKTGYQSGRSGGEIVGKVQGRAEGKAEWFGKFEAPCSKCGKPLVFDSTQPEVRKVVWEALRDWHHAGACPP